MAASLFYNRVKYTPASAGTGDFVTSAAATGFRTPAGASIPDGTLVSYAAFITSTGEWETGQGAYTVATTTVARTTVRESSNAGAKVNFTVAPTVALDLQAQDIALYAPLVSPSFTTPALGVATATSLAIGGATIGTNALAVTGTALLAGGTITASTPALNITQTWNNAAVTSGGIFMNITDTSSNGNALLFDFQVDSTSIFRLRKTGVLFSTQYRSPNGSTFSDGGLTFAVTSALIFYSNDTSLSRNAAGVWQFGTSAANTAGSWLATSAGIGTTPAISASTFLNFSAGTTAASQFRLVAGAAPTSPVDGDVWREDNTNTGVKIRINGVTKTITVS